jgi:hypothetical protein
VTPPSGHPLRAGMVDEVAAVLIVRRAQQTQIVAGVTTTGGPRCHMVKVHVLLAVVVAVRAHRAASVVAVPDRQAQMPRDRVSLTAPHNWMSLIGTREALGKDLAQRHEAVDVLHGPLLAREGVHSCTVEAVTDNGWSTGALEGLSWIPLEMGRQQAAPGPLAFG